MTFTTPHLAPCGPIRDFTAGLLLPFRALRLIFTSPRLFALSSLCAVVTVATLFGVAVASWHGARALADRLVGQSSAVVDSVLAVVLSLVFFAISALTVPNLVLAPLQDPLSEATELALGGFSAPPFSLARLAHGTFESLRHTLLRVALMALGYLVLLPANFLPVVGNVVWVVGSTLWSAFWLSVEHFSNPMARHLRPFGQVTATLRQRLALALGFGGCLWVLLWVPVVNFFLMPVAVVAGTLLFRALDGNVGAAHAVAAVEGPVSRD